MESEEVTWVKRGTEGSCKRRVEKKKKHGASRLPDADQTVEEESVSWLQRCTDASSKGAKGEIAGGSEHRQVKRKRVEHKRQVKRKRVEHKRLHYGNLTWLVEYEKKLDLEYAKMALEFYEKSQDDAEFEILEVLNRSNSRLQHPESESGNLWSHISFIAKPRKDDCNVSPKHFFGEFFRDDDSGKIQVTYCSTFQPSDDPEFNHGCIFCPPGQKFHPSNGYCVGRPPWHRRIVVFGHPSRVSRLTPKA